MSGSSEKPSISRCFNMKRAKADHISVFRLNSFLPSKYFAQVFLTLFSSVVLMRCVESHSILLIFAKQTSKVNRRLNLDGVG